MAKKYPIVAVTGSSGAGTTTTKIAMQQIFRRHKFKAVIVEGDSFHKYDRKGMQEALKQAAEEGRNLSHFGPEGNEFR
ncbi:MAG: phosphoribulokinase, partial [Gammaproteobacteria bacterium]